MTSTRPKRSWSSASGCASSSCSTSWASWASPSSPSGASGSAVGASGSRRATPRAEPSDEGPAEQGGAAGQGGVLRGTPARARALASGAEDRRRPALGPRRVQLGLHHVQQHAALLRDVPLHAALLRRVEEVVAQQGGLRRVPHSAGGQELAGAQGQRRRAGGQV